MPRNDDSASLLYNHRNSQKTMQTLPCYFQNCVRNDGNFRLNRFRHILLTYKINIENEACWQRRSNITCKQRKNHYSFLFFVNVL